jgi:hypothetical protein
MTDCPNAEMRDRLPDLLHERLEASARAAVIVHVDGCADCRAELALLRRMRVSLSSGIVAIDSAAIVRTVVMRTAGNRVAPIHRGRWTDWRPAAAIAVLAIGGASFAALYGTHVHSRSRVAQTPLTAVMPPVATVTASPVPATPPTPGPAIQTETPKPLAELAAAGDVGDLSESELRTLLGDLDTIEAVPPTEPEPVTVRVTLPERGGTE